MLFWVRLKGPAQGGKPFQADGGVLPSSLVLPQEWQRGVEEQAARLLARVSTVQGKMMSSANAECPRYLIVSRVRNGVKGMAPATRKGTFIYSG
jgi:hypothetical protein